MSILDKDYWNGMEQMLDDMPQNRVLYCDSGCWTIYAEDFATVLYEQDVNESLKEFITRAYRAENVYQYAFDPEGTK
jgi:hypothetical protein